MPLYYGGLGALNYPYKFDYVSPILIEDGSNDLRRARIDRFISIMEQNSNNGIVWDSYGVSGGFRVHVNGHSKQRFNWSSFEVLITKRLLSTGFQLLQPASAGSSQSPSNSNGGGDNQQTSSVPAGTRILFSSQGSWFGHALVINQTTLDAVTQALVNAGFKNVRAEGSSRQLTVTFVTGRDYSTLDQIAATVRTLNKSAGFNEGDAGSIQILAGGPGSQDNNPDGESSIDKLFREIKESFNSLGIGTSGIVIGGIIVVTLISLTRD